MTERVTLPVFISVFNRKHAETVYQALDTLGS